jgi:hypothetical protein
LEERISSIIRVKKSVSRWLQTERQSKTSYIRTEREGEWATWEFNSEGEMGEQVAGHSRYRSMSGAGGRGRARKVY